MNAQEQMKAKLEACGVPFKRIDCYGAQIVVTCFARPAAERFASIIGKFAKVRGIIDAIDYAVINQNTSMIPSTVRVVRVFARI